jgi:hypothetical protein
METRKYMADKRLPNGYLDMVIPTNKGLLFALYFKRGTEITGAVSNLKPQ